MYYCLSPPPCQVEEHTPDNQSTVPSHRNSRLQFSNTLDISPSAPTPTRKTTAARWARRIKQRQAEGTLAYTVKAKPHRQYIIGVDDKELQQGIQNGTIATTVANSGASSSIGNKDDPSKWTGQPSHKRFILPSGEIVQATEMAEYPFEVRAPANELHITPGVSQDSLLSTSKFADANYITVYDKETVNIYDATIP